MQSAVDSVVHVYLNKTYDDDDDDGDDDNDDDGSCLSWYAWKRQRSVKQKPRWRTVINIKCSFDADDANTMHA